MSGGIEKIGEYRLLNQVSTGQYSRFWEAIDDSTRAHYGIKVLLPKFQSDSGQISSLRREYQVGTNFDHPNVIKVLHFGRDKKDYYLVMEWFAAPNLKILINRDYLNYASRVQELFPLMLQAVDYLHTKNWIHRDLKPDNFLCDDTNNLKLIDFGMSQKKKTGLAKFFHTKAKAQGTASYLAPEQIRGEPPHPCVDIYSLGCTFFEILSGRPPFAAGSLNELLQKHISAAPPVLSTRNKNVTPEFSRLVQTMMAKKGANRPTSLRDVLASLKNMPILAKPPTENDIV